MDTEPSDKKSIVVAVSGPSGAGKTTLALALAERLGDGAVIGFDRYQAEENAKLRDFVLHDHAAWDAAGYDPNEMAPPPARGLEDLRSLLAGRAVHPPGSVKPIEPSRFVFFESAFARDLDVLNPLIDFSVHLDLPLDIALCRVLQRFVHKGADPMAWVQSYLDSSLHHFYARLQRVGDGADLVVDASRPADDVADEVAAAVRARFG